MMQPNNPGMMNYDNMPNKLAGSMAKDKKPFTYLPGGLDFSEIKSPRMAKRLAKHQQHIVKVNLTVYNGC